MVKVVSSITYGLRTSAILSCRLIALAQIHRQAISHPVSCVVLFFEVVLTDVALGWNMFVVAMTPNQDLRTNLISSIYNATQPGGYLALNVFSDSPRSARRGLHSSGLWR
jgi:hypothetical protein